MQLVERDPGGSSLACIWGHLLGPEGKRQEVGTLGAEEMAGRNGSGLERAELRCWIQKEEPDGCGDKAGHGELRGFGAQGVWELLEGPGPSQGDAVESEPRKSVQHGGLPNHHVQPAKVDVEGWDPWPSFSCMYV